jgi:hypothetical protein
MFDSGWDLHAADLQLRARARWGLQENSQPARDSWAQGTPLRLHSLQSDSRLSLAPPPSRFSLSEHAQSSGSVHGFPVKC